MLWWFSYHWFITGYRTEKVEVWLSMYNFGLINAFPAPFLPFTSFSFFVLYFLFQPHLLHHCNDWEMLCHWQNNDILQYQFCFSGVATSNAKSSKIQNKFVKNKLSSSFHHSLIIIIIMRGNISYLHLMKSTQLYWICVCIYIYIYIYICSALRKYLYPIIFFIFCYVSALC